MKGTKRPPELTRTAAELEKEPDLRELFDAIRRCNTDTAMRIMLEALSIVLGDDRKFRALIKMDRDQFNYVLDMVEATIRRMRGRAKLYRDAGVREGDAGNRCLLSIQQALLLFMAYERNGISQTFAGILFGVSQPTVSRYVDDMREIVNGLLPTGSTIEKMIRQCKTKREVKRIVPGPGGGRLLGDCFNTGIQRAKKNAIRLLTYSGRRKAFSLVTFILTNHLGLIVSIGATVGGATPDIDVSRKMKPRLGWWGRTMTDKFTPARDRIELILDKGFQGLHKFYKGAIVRTPYKKYGGELPIEHEEYNRMIGRIRIRVEHAIRRIKDNPRMNAAFANTFMTYGIEGVELELTIREFRRVLETASGFANLSLMWADIKSGRGPIGSMMAEKRRNLGLPPAPLPR